MATAAYLSLFIFIFKVFGIVGLIIVASIIRGYVLSIMWGWFVVPIFNLPSLGIAQSIGIAMVIAMLTHQYIPTKDKDNWQPWFNVLIGPWLALGAAWIVKGYMYK